MILHKNVDIKLTKDQQAYCMRAFNALLAIWNDYIELQQYWLDDGRGWVNNYTYDTQFFRIMKTDKPWYNNAPSCSAQKVLSECFHSMLLQYKKNHVLRYRKKSRKPIRSLYLEKKGIRFLDKNHIWLPLLHSVKLLEKGYLTEKDLEYVTSARIVLVPSGKWHVSFTLQNIPDDYYSSQNHYPGLSSGIGIDLGIHNMITAATNDEDIVMVLASNTTNPAFDKRAKFLTQKIERLEEVIGHKASWNKRNPSVATTHPYHSHAIMKLRKRCNRYYAELTNHKRDSLKKAASILARSKPVFISIEDIDAINLMSRNSIKPLQRQNQNACYAYFRDFLKWKCSNFNVPVIEVPVYWPSTQRCSRCGHHKTGKEKLKLSERIYRCNECGSNIDRDINSARNMLWWGYAYGTKSVGLGYEAQ